MTLETAARQGLPRVVDMREPEKTYHLQPIETFMALSGPQLHQTLKTPIHSPRVN